MRILIPKRFDLSSAVNFANTIDSVKDDREYIYDYKYMRMVEPFGMLFIGSKIRKFMDDKEDCEHCDINFENTEYAAHEYAAHMGYFKSVYQDFGKEPGEAKGSSRYIPITELVFEEIKKEDTNNNIYEYIEDIAEKLVSVLAVEGEVNRWLKFSIVELLRNVYEHSESPNFWYAGQYWPSKDLVEVAILDEGIGIKNSFLKNKKITAADDEDAIRLAMQPGISNTGIGKTSRCEYDNEGFGLYMISNICKQTGNFVICSGNKCLEITSSGTNIYETSFQGTAIRIRIKPSQAKQLDKIAKDLSLNGSKKAKEYRKLREVSVDSINVNIV